MIKVTLIILFWIMISSSIFADDPGIPDSVYFGNLDGSPVIAGLGEEISVPVWIKTDDPVGFIHLPLATNDSFVVERMDGEHVITTCILCMPPGYPMPEQFQFMLPDSMNSQWTNQSLLALWSFEPLNTQYFWCHKFNFFVRTTSDPAVIGDTVFCFAEGFCPHNGGPLFGLNDGVHSFVPVLQFGSLYFAPTGIDNKTTISNRFVLLGAHPNPFNASTTIEFTLAEAMDVELSIYNILGQKIETLFDGRKAAGKHAITWDAGDAPSGLYFARLEADKHSKNSKMILLR